MLLYEDLGCGCVCLMDGGRRVWSATKRVYITVCDLGAGM